MPQMSKADLKRLLAANPDITLAQEDLDWLNGKDTTNKQAYAKESPLESRFINQWYLLGFPQLEREYQYHPSRKWRADFAHVAARVLIEIEGGTRNPKKPGRHNRHGGYRDDCIKYNAAQELGWLVIRLTGDMIQPDQLEEICDTITQRSNAGGTPATARRRPP